MEKLIDFINVAAIRAVGMLPLARARTLGASLGRMAHRFNTRMAVYTRLNIEHCLPSLDEAAQKKLIRQSLEHTGQVATEMCSIITRPKPISDYVLNIDGLEVVQDYLAKGKGLLVIGPHLGNWEILGLYLPALGQVTSLYQPPRHENLNQLILKSRETTGANLVPTTGKGVSALLKCLKNGGISGILPDQNPNDRSSGEFAPFFGHPAFTMTLIHKLLLKTGASAVFAFAKRVPGGFELVFRAAPQGIYSADSQTSLAALNKGVEDLVMEAPEQYQWEYKRFKIRPQGTQDMYRKTP